MADIVSLVKGDTLSNLQITLSREDTGGTFVMDTDHVATLHIRPKGNPTVSASVANTASLSNPSTGLMVFGLGTFLSTSSTEPGFYEGEVEIVDNGETPATTQTVFDAIKFRVRDQFAWAT